jgi:V/A-type H+-transporting ATPase subunit D
MIETTPTRSAYLELQEEQVGMQEGYRFLDEKRLVLAAETLQELERYESLKQGFMDLYRNGAKLLQAAVSRHGLSGLEIYPVNNSQWTDMQKSVHSVLGLPVNQVSLVNAGVEQGNEPALNASPEATETALLFSSLVEKAAVLAACNANLVRLYEEYRQTSRRARALEDVLLPEIAQTLAHIDASLEEMDTEEIVRVRHSIEALKRS